MTDFFPIDIRCTYRGGGSNCDNEASFVASPDFTYTSGDWQVQPLVFACEEHVGAKAYD